MIIFSTKLLLLACSLSAAQPQNPQRSENLIAGLVARSAAIFSGEIEFQEITNIGAKETARQNVVITRSGPSWCLLHRLTNEDDVLYVNHKDAFLEKTRTLQRDESVRTTLSIKNSKSFGELFQGEGLRVPPSAAGSVWYQATLNYLESHSADVRLAGDGNVDGIPVRVLEWDVPKRDVYSAFGAIISSLNGGGVLRVSVSPELGFVVPSIEYLTPSGQVATQIHATDFEEVAAGIHYPIRFGIRTFPDGRPGFSKEFEVVRITNVNEPIPEERFIVDLPVGTSVADRRQEPGLHFVVGDLTGELPGGLTAIARLTQTATRTGHKATIRGILVGLNVAVIILIAGYLWARRSRRPSN